MAITNTYIDGNLTILNGGFTNHEYILDGNTSTKSTGGTGDSFYANGIYDSFGGSSITSIRYRVHNGSSWSSYRILATPTGGFTPQSTKTLGVYISKTSTVYQTQINGSTGTLATRDVTSGISKVELEVTHTPPSIQFDSTSDLVVVGVITPAGAVTFEHTSDLLENGYTEFIRSISFEHTHDLEIVGFKTIAQKQIERKSYSYKIYNSAGNYIGTWNDVISEFGYSHEINSPGSSVTIELARNSDTKFKSITTLTLEDNVTPITTEDLEPIEVVLLTNNNIGTGTDVDLNHTVEIYEYYGSQSVLTTESGEPITTESLDPIYVTLGAPNGRPVFTGYISAINSRYGGSETIRVQLLSFGDELDNYVLEDALGKTKVAYNSYDPSDIFKDTLDKFNTAGGIVTYDASTIDLTGSIVSYTFNTNTELEVLKKSLELTPRDWYWYVDLGTSMVHLHKKATAANHTFVLEKHIKDLDIERYMTDLTNLVYFTGGETSPGVNLFKKYSDAGSISTFRRGLQRFSDSRVTVPQTADTISNAEIDRHKEPAYRTTITILAEVYPIEDIRLGDMVGFKNFDNYVDDLLMQIVGIDYTPDAITLQLDTLPPNINKRIQDIKRNLDVKMVQQNPDTPS